MTTSHTATIIQVIGGMEISEDFVITDAEAADAADIIAQLAKRLRACGYTKEGFYEALIKREKDFPTGLVTKTVPVAIPHADPDYVEKPALAVAILKQGIAFRQMDDPKKTVEVRLVFLVALSEAEAQIEFLRRFALAIQTDHFLPSLLKARDPARVCGIVIRELTNVNGSENSIPA